MYLNEITIKPSNLEVFPKSLNQSQTAQMITSQEITRAEEISLPGDLAQPIIAEDINDLLRIVISSAGLAPNDSNIKMVMDLLSKDFPATKENIIKFNQGMKLTNNNPEMTAFLMKNEIRLNFSNAQILNNLVGLSNTPSTAESKFQLTEQIREMAEEIVKLPPSPQKTALLQNLLSQAPIVSPTAIPEETILPQPQNYAQLVENVKSHALLLATEQLQALRTTEFTIPQMLENKEEFLQEILKDPIALPEKLLEALKGSSERNGLEVVEIISKGIFDQNPALLERVLTSLRKNAERFEESLIRQIIDKFTLDSSKPQEINRMINELRELAVSITENKIPAASISENKIPAESITENATPAASISENAQSLSASPRLMQIAQNVLNTTDFLNQLTQIAYLQLPIAINNHATTAELYIFKDGGNRKQSKSGGATSALISLNLTNLGVVEAYIQRHNRSINCQFRLDTDSTKSLIQSNIEKLTNMLSSFGFSLDMIQYHAVKEPFSLIQQEPADSE
ncbi:MAG: flagellar hook-length control protein FliK, partial [Defluviitaleaceae bacterium]|nr:flagellar hook-length control protein FliK [Defluviitaleaceae bacterium]